MDAERGVLRAAHLAVLVTLAEPIGRWRVLQFRCSSEKLCRILLVLQKLPSACIALEPATDGAYLEDDVFDSLFVQDGQLVQTLRLWRLDLVCELCRAREPLHAVLRPLRESEFAVQLGETKAVHGADVREDGCAAAGNA